MDLIDALDNYGIRYKKASKPGEIWLCCPFCTDDRFRLGVNVSSGDMHCFNEPECDTRSRNAEYTFKKLSEALELGELEAAAARSKESDRPAVKVRLPDDFELVPWRTKTHKVDYWAQKASDFLQSRHVSKTQIEEKKLGYCTTGPYAYRIVIPVFYKGKLRGLVTRALKDSQKPKYKNSIGQKVLYNVPKKKSEAAVLVEGVFDALAVDRAIAAGGSYDGIAVLGHSLTDRQISMLDPYKAIYLWPDPDKPGVLGFCEMGTKLKKKGREIFFVRPHLNGEDYDPAELFREEILRRLKHAAEFTDGLCDKYRLHFADEDL
jgi:hypothetical protein